MAPGTRMSALPWAPPIGSGGSLKVDSFGTSGSWDQLAAGNLTLPAVRPQVPFFRSQSARLCEAGGGELLLQRE